MHALAIEQIIGQTTIEMNESLRENCNKTLHENCDKMVGPTIAIFCNIPV